MSRTVRYGELLLGIEGAALFRHLLGDDDEFVRRRVDAIRRLASDDARMSYAIEAPEVSVTEGYTAWAPVYDTMPNPLILAEEPLVAAVTSDLPVGRALDVACGTGRHAAWLAAAGHATTGVDGTPAMLDVARQRVPNVDFRLGDLTDLPVADADFDFAICALALAHFEDLRPAIREIARATRPGGRIVLTDAHPTFVRIQGQALFPTDDGLAFVRNYPHAHGNYLAAFRDAGLTVLECLEAPMVSDFSTGMFVEAQEAAHAFWDDIPAALVWSLAKPASRRPMELRGATAQDIEAIAALHADSWRRNYRGAFPDAYLDGDVFSDRLAVWAERLRVPRAEAFTVVADVDGALAGFAHTVLDEDRELGALLDNLHVTHTRKRAGIGSRLLAESARRLVACRPDSGLYLEVLEQNTAAQAFYEARGGSRVGSGRVVPVEGGGTACCFTYAWPSARVERLA